MWNNKLGLATLAIGSFLTLLGPAVASARDRDDFRQNDSGYRNSYQNRQNDRERERIRLERERFEHRQNRNRFYTNSYARPNAYGYRETRGYYDNAGCWHDSYR